MWDLTNCVCILCTALPFIKDFKRQPDDGTLSGQKHAAPSQSKSWVEKKSVFFFSEFVSMD